MARECSVCGKSKKTGMSVSHSHRRTRRVFAANLQTVKTAVGRVLACTGCIKAGKVEKG